MVATDQDLRICAEVTYRAPGWQGMAMQMEDTPSKIERMRREVAAFAGCTVDEVECVLDDTRPVLIIRPKKAALRDLCHVAVQCDTGREAP